MDIRFLGGANEIGASSALITIDGYKILVDAGIRTIPVDKRVPEYLECFNKVGIPDAVLVTHAHTDHIGALPVLRDFWNSGVKLYYTPVTKEISHVMLKRSLKDMEQEKEIPPLYSQDDLDVLLHCMDKEVPWLEPIQICPGLTATWIPAGHILGAGMIYIQGKHESILWTGDVSVTPQLTVQGVHMPHWCKPDTMVMEATYAGSLHEVSRQEEESRLVQDVYKVISDGGKVLIPVFAIGRAQEVILILKQAMERKEIPEFRVYVDGMVQDMNRIYQNFANELPPSLRRKAKRGKDIFYSDVIQPIKNNDARQELVSGGPCCIVASSGMLNGGRSSGYARKIATDLKNLIAITGHQAKGTPGQALWDWQKTGRPSDKKWKLDDQAPVEVKSSVKKYSLSAHADSKQLTELVEQAKPNKLLLVHGNEKPRRHLSKSIKSSCQNVHVILPRNGCSYTVKKRPGIVDGRKLGNDMILQELSRFLQQMKLKGPFGLRELAEFWFGSKAITPIKLKYFQWCLSLDFRYFKREMGNLYCLR